MTDSSEQLFYRGAMRRIYRALFAVSVAGFVAAVAWKGGRAGAAFALGAALSAANFLLLHRMVEGMGSPDTSRASGRTAALIGLRYLAMGGTAYAIVKYFELSGLGVVAGLLAATASVLIEIVYELIYART